MELHKEMMKSTDAINITGRGAKLSVTYSTATTPVLASGVARRYKTDFVRHYGAGRVVRADSVEMVMHPYGYYDGEGRVRYYLHDFQGNVTMVVDNEGEVLQHTRYYPYGEAIDVFDASEVGMYHGASAGRSDLAQPYLYGGKELERMHGLGEYDYGARRLQSHLSLWTTQDPCLEKYYATSPYAYCAANPIRFTDPTGCETIFQWNPELSPTLNYILAFVALTEIQKLTNDKLGLKVEDKKISLVIKEERNPNDFNKNLGQNKPQGTMLMRLLINHKQILTIDLYNSKKSKTAEGKLIDYPSTKSTDSDKPQDVTTLFFPGKQINTYVYNSEKDRFEEEIIPEHITMGHEFIHALIKMNGESSKYRGPRQQHTFKWQNFTLSEFYQDGAPILIPLTEFYVIGFNNYKYIITENVIRMEQGLNPRATYGTLVPKLIDAD